ncbi:MAG TPA: 1,4-alpha-glucan branching protein GlgB [Terriglobia bacterium]|nr:1,4-alpha-glucan branching protein GlgB [Terriglobia bacterium]
MVHCDVSLLTDDDLHYFNEGTHYRLYRKFGSHLTKADGVEGAYFAVWAPNAERVCVIGDFNFWDKSNRPLQARGQSGIWEGFVPGIRKGARYKLQVYSRYNGYQIDKADPFAYHSEVAPQNASIVWDLDYSWGDEEWMLHRAARNSRENAMSTYEVHLGSWMRSPDDPERFFSYRDVAAKLADYAEKMGFTHIEFLPLMEHPYYPSWGYQITGYFAATSRYGTPQDLMYLIDLLHQRGIGVILDWVPSHFPNDGHGLGYFDGTHLYEHADPRQGFHPEWKSFIFNYGRAEVRSFLLSSALFWLDYYHADGLRVDGVASMLYLDYARKEGEWIPNKYGGKENLEAIDFLRQMNTAVYGNYPDVQTIAEESTAWGMVSRPADIGGLGFGMKWDMGWMHDTLNYMSQDPLFRSHHYGELTFRMIYAFTENFVLPLSHDEVVHMKGSLLRKMPGDDWQKFANLRLLLGYMYAQPGKKLLFMGDEIGQWDEWKYSYSVDWHLLQFPPHQGMQKWVEDLNRFYRTEPAMHELDFDPAGFEWINCNDAASTALSFIRKGRTTQDLILAICNFTPVIRTGYRTGVPRGGFWKEMMNGDSTLYGGVGQGNAGGMEAEAVSSDGRPYSLVLTLPPLAAVFFKSSGA